jgi:hypothetical protein
MASWIDNAGNVALWQRSRRRMAESFASWHCFLSCIHCSKPNALHTPMCACGQVCKGEKEGNDIISSVTYPM